MGKKRNQLSFKERKELEELFIAIEELETEQNSLEAFFQTSGISPDELERNNRRYKSLCIDLESKMKRWEELADRT